MGREWRACDTEQLWTDSVLDLGPTSHYGGLVLDGEWSVAFVDCHGDFRKASIEFLRNRVELIVVHDTTAEDPSIGDRNWLPLLATFPHRYDYTRMMPYTTVVSMTRTYAPT
jgi:hypothetical protein